MNAAQLIAYLQTCPPDMPVMILDGFNGGGDPRDLNCGPRVHTITTQNAEQTADCEDRVGEQVVVLGYGCY